MALLEVKDLTKHFDVSGGWPSRLITGRKILKAVDGVSFAVPEGKVFGLVGESGCGKSTTARLITRLIAATAGEVYFDGREILRLPDKAVRQLRKQIQIIFQDPYASLNPRMKVVDIVGRPVTIFDGIRGRKRVDRVVGLLELVGLAADHLQRYPHEFSGGQRQRIGIARALAANPRLIIADEPVSSLDVSVQAQVLNLLKRLQRELKLSMVFISHDL
ncbi:MAG TPA: dipeptide/oligopeptide/nickel ABC transporter ATP-binding protein, partial [Candidatus Binatia bacterium]